MENDQLYENETYNRRKKTRSALIRAVAFLLAIAITAILAASVSWNAAKRRYEAEDGKLVDSVRQERNIMRENFYYYEEDETALTDAVLKGLVSATGDLYADYYTEKEYAELTQQNNRNFVGIGILTQLNDSGEVEILDVYEDTPASEAGLMAGDIMTEINGAAYDGASLTDFLANVHAEDGALNTIVVRRGEQTLTFDVTAREVHTPSVSYRMLTEEIGYIHIQTFHGTCVEETKTAVAELRKAGMRSLVLDLRDNLGGSLYDALDIADIFLPRDYTVTTLRSRDGRTTEFKTKKNGFDIRTVLLVNEYSASASELVAGALKDYEAAYLIGVKTYGKGIVQTFYEIPETKGWIKFTTDAYYTPNGICVQDEGITPDEIVELPEEAQRYSIDRIPQDLDTQLAAAIRYLED